MNGSRGSPCQPSDGARHVDGKPTAVTVRAASADDLLGLVALLRGSVFVAGDPAIANDVNLPDLLYLTNAGTYVAEYAGRLVGSYRLHQRNVPSRPEADLHFLVVAPHAGAEGAARLLLEDATRRAASRGADGVELFVSPPFDVVLAMGARVRWIEPPSPTSSAGLRVVLPVPRGVALAMETTTHG